MPSMVPLARFSASSAFKYGAHVAGSLFFAGYERSAAVNGGLVHFCLRNCHFHRTQWSSLHSGASAAGRFARSPLIVFGLFIAAAFQGVRRANAATCLASRTVFDGRSIAAYR